MKAYKFKINQRVKIKLTNKIVIVEKYHEILNQDNVTELKLYCKWYDLDFKMFHYSNFDEEELDFE